MKLIQKQLIIEYFTCYPNQNIDLNKVVDWAREEYQHRTGKRFYHPDSLIRQLNQEGFLIKVRRGIYRHNPDTVPITAPDYHEKNYHQIETGIGMFISFYNRAKSLGDDKLLKFCTEVLEVYERNGINSHIVWER